MEPGNIPARPAIARASVVLARRAIVDGPTIAIALIALGLSLRFRIPEPVLIPAGGAAGLLILGTAG